jgi:hypothetical protein
MPAYGAAMPMGMPMGMPAYGAAMPAMGYSGGYPVFSGMLAPNMFYKPIWTPKREMKLQR